MGGGGAAVYDGYPEGVVVPTSSLLIQDVLRVVHGEAPRVHVWVRYPAIV